jgi:hypothetical protein
LIDVKSIPVIDVARTMLGQETRERSNSKEKHFPNNGGLFVNVQKNRWFSHGNDTGGDAASLVSFLQGSDFLGSVDWLRENGYVVGDHANGKSNGAGKFNIVAEYDYPDENGKVLYQVVRFHPKDFRQRRPDGKGGWVWKLGDVRHVPYRLPELLAEVDRPVLICGGEKDVDNLRALGLTATCNHGGEGKWWTALTQWFKGRRVFILCDNDTQGEKHQAVVGAALDGTAGEIHVVRFPELPEGGDISDLIEIRRNAGLDSKAIVADLAVRFREAPAWARPAEPTIAKTTAAKVDLPELGREAYVGLAGSVVDMISPHSEADPVAILIQFLAAAGNLVGRRCYYQVESDRHHANLFAVLVGQSSKARKGTSWGRVKAVAKVADSAWGEDRCRGGLSSGEGLINEVRDSVTKWDAKTQTWDEVDPGISDKRLMLIEPEFAGALSVMERHGNTISPLLRRAWDGDTLATMTRSSPLKSTGSHISIVGHITEDELRARLTRTDAANGFANRFLFPLVKRSKELPFGGELTDSEIQALGEMLGNISAGLPAQRQVTMTDDARKLWAAKYHDLSEGKPGLLGAVTARAEAQVVRLAMLYALLDKKLEIDQWHLEAGLEVWRYCEASAAHIFGQSLGDPVADEILAAIRMAGDAGLSRTAMRDMFGRHKTKDQIGAALGTLLKMGLAIGVLEETAGRPAELWRAA